MKLFVSSLLFALVFASGCSSVKPVLLPEPNNYARPILSKGFYNCIEEDATVVCMPFEDAQDLLEYVVATEVELRKCAITVQEVNKERK